MIEGHCNHGFEMFIEDHSALTRSDCAGAPNQANIHASEPAIFEAKKALATTPMQSLPDLASPRFSSARPL